jgi:hypothetical protein
MSEGKNFTDGFSEEVIEGIVTSVLDRVHEAIVNETGKPNRPLKPTTEVLLEDIATILREAL